MGIISQYEHLCIILTANGRPDLGRFSYHRMQIFTRLRIRWPCFSTTALTLPDLLVNHDRLVSTWVKTHLTSMLNLSKDERTPPTYIIFPIIYSADCKKVYNLLLWSFEPDSIFLFGSFVANHNITVFINGTHRF